MSTPADARKYDRAEPFYLVEITPVGQGSPVFYLSTRQVVVEGTAYESYLAEVEGVGESLDRRGLGALNSMLRLGFSNEPWRGYSHLVLAGQDYPFEGAAVELKEAYIGPGGEPTSAELLLKGVLGGPAGIDLMGFSALMSGMEFRADMK